MPAITDGRGAMRDPAPPGSRWRRLGWFVLLWLGGVVAVGAVAFLLRSLLHP
ncbi:DUF2474 family protein [Roseomonas mucosa]